MPRRSSSPRIRGPGSLGNCSRKWVARPCRGNVLEGRAPAGSRFQVDHRLRPGARNQQADATGTALKKFMYEALICFSARRAAARRRNGKILPVGENFMPAPYTY